MLTCSGAAFAPATVAQGKSEVVRIQDYPGTGNMLFRVAVGNRNTAFGALTSRRVDANMSFEPSGAIYEVLKACKTIYRGAESREPVELHVTNGAAVNAVVVQDMLDRTPHVVEALIAAARDAEAFIQDPRNFTEALNIAQSHFKLDMARGDEVMAVALKAQIPTYRVSISRSALKAIADNTFATKQIADPFDPTRLIYGRAP